VLNTFDAAGYIGGTVIVLAVCLVAATVNPVETRRADS
jgi:hypothetical protein